jgi:hypothetical protein
MNKNQPGCRPSRQQGLRGASAAGLQLLLVLLLLVLLLLVPLLLRGILSLCPAAPGGAAGAC